MSKTWIYHTIEQPMLVEEHQAFEYYKQGWADTPAAFLNKGESNESSEGKTDEPSAKRQAPRKRERMLTNDNSE